MGTGLWALGAAGVARMGDTLAFHLGLPKVEFCNCPPDAILCTIAVLVRVYNQLAGHPC